MKKEEQTLVDAYFQRHEADIPVAFDPKHWEQLAAALDHAARPDLPPPPATSKGRKHYGGNKGWWVSGVWVLALLSSAWVLWQRTQVAAPVAPAIHSTSEKPQPVAPAHPMSAFPVPSPASDAAAEKAETTQTEHGTAESARENPAEDSGHRTTASESEILPGPDSLQMHLPAPSVAPADTTSAGKKKKKHLFW